MHLPSVELKLASKCFRTEPDYYKQVKSPIDFTRIQQKLKTEEYQTFEEFCEDVELLVDNTRTYYKVGDSLVLIFKSISMLLRRRNDQQVIYLMSISG